MANGPSRGLEFKLAFRTGGHLPACTEPYIADETLATVASSHPVVDVPVAKSDPHGTPVVPTHLCGTVALSIVGGRLNSAASFSPLPNSSLV